MKNDFTFPRPLRAFALLILANLITLVAGAQTTWIANSTPGAASGTNVFTGANSINAAIAAASNGDIIYVVPSGVIYNHVTFGGKQISIFGVGFNPSHASGAFSQLAGVTLNSNNARISGLVLVGDVIMSGTFSNIVIDNCKFLRLADNSGGSAKGNMIIQNCVIGDGNSSGGTLLIGGGSTNIRINNNIIFCHALNPYCIGEASDTMFEHNLFVGSSSGQGGAAFSDAVNCTIQNNIFLAVNPNGIGPFTGNTFRNNITFDASNNTFPSVNNVSTDNIEGQDPMLVNYTLGNTFIITNDAHLKPGSPAIGTGIGGVDMGIYSGLTPFNDAASALPVVRSISAPTMIGEGSDLTIRVQAEGN